MADSRKRVWKNWYRGEKLVGAMTREHGWQAATYRRASRDAKIVLFGCCTSRWLDNGVGAGARLVSGQLLGVVKRMLSMSRLTLLMK